MQESGEMYLETILVLSKRLNVVRSVDIAEEMGYSKPSVSRAVGKLKEDKYIVVDEDGFIALTGKGRTVAERIYERHTVLTDLLIRIGVSPETAAADACRVEHDISEETFEAIKKTV
ncbi:MAG: metal-dependent transcriptional regulator, partial [Lachnospiraceae bacterium]|nr:metal-dependent transcriptional regulator [Lachnospiraceae bacterium]